MKTGKWVGFAWVSEAETWVFLGFSFKKRGFERGFWTWNLSPRKT